jgi:hypothetical protein
MELSSPHFQPHQLPLMVVVLMAVISFAYTKQKPALSRFV